MITWEEPAKPVQFKLMYVASRGDGGDAEDKHLRAAGYVPATEMAEVRRQRDAAVMELNQFRVRLKRPCGEPSSEAPGARTIHYAQALIAQWVSNTLGPAIASNAGERVLRFVEEAVELAQACDAEPWMLHRLVDYVYGRPKGTAAQEVAGSLVTLLAVASALGVNVESAFELEQARIHQPEIIEKVRNRQKEKREALVAAPLAIKGED